MKDTRMPVSSSLVFLCAFLYFSNYVISDDKLGVRDANHMKSHLQGTIDIGNLTRREQLFHYFQVHDVEGNNRLDGIELLQSLLHVYSEATAIRGAPERLFTDYDLANIVDAVLERNDKNLDGFIDYSEFLSGEMNRAF